jgi:2-phosphosulfolactate phosphatase
VSEFEQAGFDARLEWGVEGAFLLARACPVVVVVDVLRFTTAVEVAVARGALVHPHRWPDPGAPAAAGGPGGLLDAPGAVSPGPFSLSPVSLLAVPPGTHLHLPSPNGATVALAAAAAGSVVLAGCLRNASAVARVARDLGGPVAVAAAGERWPDGTLRPAVEDLLGAGAVLHALGGRPSPEARAAVAAFRGATDLRATLVGCVSGRELAARGLGDDLGLAAEHDVSRVVPVLRDGAFGQLS